MRPCNGLYWNFLCWVYSSAGIFLGDILAKMVPLFSRDETRGKNNLNNFQTLFAAISSRGLQFCFALE